MRVSAVRDVVLPHSSQEVLAVIRDIELLEPLERKARSVEVHPVDDTHGWYHIVGKLFRVRAWEGEFSYEQHPSGGTPRTCTPGPTDGGSAAASLSAA